MITAASIGNECAFGASRIGQVMLTNQPSNSLNSLHNMNNFIHGKML